MASSGRNLLYPGTRARGMSLQTMLSPYTKSQQSMHLNPQYCALMPKPELDTIDRRIVIALQTDARLSNVDLADKVGLSPSPCLRRVKRLEREGYIDGYRASLQRSRVGLGFSVFLGVRINGHANEEASRFEKAVVAMPEVIACHLVSGEADYFL